MAASLPQHFTKNYAALCGFTRLYAAQDDNLPPRLEALNFNPRAKQAPGPLQAKGCGWNLKLRRITPTGHGPSVSPPLVERASSRAAEHRSFALCQRATAGKTGPRLLTACFGHQLLTLAHQSVQIKQLLHKYLIPLYLSPINPSIHRGDASRQKPPTASTVYFSPLRQPAHGPKGRWILASHPVAGKTPHDTPALAIGTFGYW